MNIEIKKTQDGSHTIFVPELNEHYHSTFGAIQESKHIFIEAGLKYFPQNSKINILEVGFGTGLNCFLTLLETNNFSQIYYTTLEKYPLQSEIYSELNYAEELNASQQQFLTLHQCDWNITTQITTNSSLSKYDTSVQDYETKKKFNLIYFDAFAPEKQPEMWTEQVFSKLHQILNTGGVLVTYCTKGDVKRALKSVGFKIEKLKGPIGKREMLRAIK